MNEIQARKKYNADYYQRNKEILKAKRRARYHESRYNASLLLNLSKGYNNINN